MECIIVDDGSSDDTPRIIREYTDSDNRFRYVPMASGLNHYAYRNDRDGSIISRHDPGLSSIFSRSYSVSNNFISRFFFEIRILLLTLQPQPDIYKETTYNYTFNAIPT